MQKWLEHLSFINGGSFEKLYHTFEVAYCGYFKTTQRLLKNLGKGHVCQHNIAIFEIAINLLVLSHNS
jgi:hypothetical protein